MKTLLETLTVNKIDKLGSNILKIIGETPDYKLFSELMNFLEDNWDNNFYKMIIKWDKENHSKQMLKIFDK